VQQIVRNYEIVAHIPEGTYQFTGNSAAEKRLVFYPFKDKSRSIKVLDVGFGVGTLGMMIKTNPETSHWDVDGIEGFDVCCKNVELFKMGFYRNIWHGYAQDLAPEQLHEYDVLCLLDVIEHLDAEGARKLVRSLLSAMRDDAFLFISTPLWFYPQDAMQQGDLEEHLIGVPASAMMALLPVMYTVSHPLVGNFIYGRGSLAFADLFQPTTDKSFTQDRGTRVAVSVGMQLEPGVVVSTGN